MGKKSKYDEELKDDIDKCDDRALLDSKTKMQQKQIKCALKIN